LESWQVSRLQLYLPNFKTFNRKTFNRKTFKPSTNESRSNPSKRTKDRLAYGSACIAATTASLCLSNLALILVEFVHEEFRNAARTYLLWSKQLRADDGRWSVLAEFVEHNPLHLSIGFSGTCLWNGDRSNFASGI
jgi:hypothetical protein